MRNLVLATALSIPLSFAGCDLSQTDIARDVEPIHELALRVLIVEETGDRPRLPQGQQAIFASAELRQYLKSHCVKGADGTPAFRMLDKDAELSNEWAATFRSHPPRSYPWLYITNGSHGYSGPLPGSVADLLKLIEPYAKPGAQHGATGNLGATVTPSRRRRAPASRLPHGHVQSGVTVAPVCGVSVQDSTTTMLATEAIHD